LSAAPPSPISIRDAAPGDAAAIIGWFRSTTQLILWTGTGLPAKPDAVWLARELRAPFHRYRVACAQNSLPVGVYGLRRSPDGATTHLRRVAVRSDRRNQGVGTRLIADAITLSRSAGCREMTLNVYGANTRARDVYEAAGFRVRTARPAPEDPTGVAFFMTLALDEAQLT
jgi:ribosomal protein S18 acetylase RimI-like enzyme